MWARNCLFFIVCLAGVGLMANTLLRRQRVPQPHAVRTASGVFAASLDRLNGDFQRLWQEEHVEAAPRASDLTIARRLSLAVTGTAPSLEEIRALEAVPANDRIAWWTNHLLEDRRFADYWAERLTRLYVGSEQGNIIWFRRRRFALWLADQLADNAPYD